MQSDFRELVLQHLEEHGQEMINSPARVVSPIRRHGEERERDVRSCARLPVGDVLLLAEDRGEAGNLRAQGCPDVLRRVRHQILNVTHNVIQESLSLD